MLAVTDGSGGPMPSRLRIAFPVLGDGSGHLAYALTRDRVGRGEGRQNVAVVQDGVVGHLSPVSTIIKGVKRAMAGEYSRELSNKVFKGQCRLIQLGYRQGGPAGYGLRRMLLDQAGQPKGLLKRGEHKSLQTDRVILVPGAQEEIDVVHSIYQRFVKEAKSEATIAGELNARGVSSGCDRQWSRGMVHQILVNEKYIGNNVYNRISFKLKKKRVCNPPEMWVRADGAFDAIVDSEMFFTARGIIQERNRTFTDEEMLNHLKTLLAVHPDLSAALIDETEGMPSSSVYRTRFGTRLEILRELGCQEVLCLVSMDDEAFTYNHKVNTVQPIQEHFMIMKALQNGVSEERIAASLNVDVKAIRTKRDLLNGICPEAIEILKEKRATAAALREMRKVTPMRQIEMAELMVAANNFSTSYAECLVATTTIPPNRSWNDAAK